jgi:GNAT superfamily N-acetyltransferase
MLEIVLAQTEVQYRQVRELLEEYIAWDATQLGQLGLDAQAALDFYFASGKEDLPGVYAPPDGRMLLASYSAQTAGCGAFHRMTADTCELRRMYVRPEFRGKQIGRQLANELLVGARELGEDHRAHRSCRETRRPRSRRTGIRFRRRQHARGNGRLLKAAQNHRSTRRQGL